MKTVRLIPPKTDWLLMCVSRTRGPSPAVATIYTWECSGSHSDFVFYISYLYFVFVIAYLCTCLLFFWLPICELVFVFVIANLCICILICDFLVVDLYFVFLIANLCICILYLWLLICVFVFATRPNSCNHVRECPELQFCIHHQLLQQLVFSTKNGRECIQRTVFCILYFSILYLVFTTKNASDALAGQWGRCCPKHPKDKSYGGERGWSAKI